ncbi:MAG TPA: mechanosensitive ion channel family protein [Phototrophicaceae bacterium]|nr:mechanosensitive ion channel family protein [Phototrophicaceae bacterium]
MLDAIPQSIRELVARVLLFVLVLIVLWFLRNLIAWLIAKPLRRLLERAGQPGMDETIQRIVVAPIGYLLLALALDIGARILELDSGLVDFVSHITRTLVIVAVALIIYRLIDVIVLTRRELLVFTGLAIDEALLPFIRTAIRLLLWALTIVIAVQEWGYDVNGLIAGLGIGGLAISLAAQDTLSNLFGFAAIVSDRPFVVGEYIKTKDVEGSIERVGLRSTRVRQADQAIVAVPNSMLASSAILNWSRLSKRKLELTLGVSYKTTPAQMEALLAQLRGLLTQHKTVDPKSITVFFVGFGESSLNVLVRCYLNIADWGTFTAEQERIFLEIMRLVEMVGLQIAFPSQSIYLENVSSAPPEIPVPNPPDRLPAQKGG